MLPKDATLRSIRKLLASEDAFVSKAYWALRRCQQTRDQPLELRIGITGTGQYPNYRIDNAVDGRAVATIDGNNHEPWPEGETFEDSSNWSAAAMTLQDVEDLLSEIRPSARRSR